jgi:hypothetical protein
VLLLLQLLLLQLLLLLVQLLLVQSEEPLSAPLLQEQQVQG